MSPLNEIAENVLLQFKPLKSGLLFLENMKLQLSSIQVQQCKIRSAQCSVLVAKRRSLDLGGRKAGSNPALPWAQYLASLRLRIPSYKMEIAAYTVT